MLTRTTYQKIANGEKLNPLEAQEFVLHMDRLQRLSDSLTGWFQPGTLTPQFAMPRISDPVWVGSALASFFAQRTTDTAITDVTNTYIEFEDSRDFGYGWRLDENDHTKVRWENVEGRAFHVSGYVTWEANATGYRGVWLQGFDKDDVSIGTTPLLTAQGFSGVDNVLPFSFSWYYNGFDYVKFYVHQSSGGDLAMKDFLIGLSLA